MTDMTQETATRMRGAGERLTRPVLLVGGGLLMAYLAWNGVAAAQCLALDGQMRLDGPTLSCVQDFSALPAAPALVPMMIPVAG